MEKYAIVLTGGKQYKVEANTVIRVEKLDAEKSAIVELPVLLISDNGTVRTGADVATAVAKAEVVDCGKGKKINIFKYKSKKNVRKRQGHRQPYTELKITEIIG
jgi:large subunit ribosomal protein L21